MWLHLAQIITMFKQLHAPLAESRYGVLRYYRKMWKMINIAQSIETKIYSVTRFFKYGRNDTSHDTRVFRLNEELGFVTRSKNILLGGAI